MAKSFTGVVKSNKTDKTITVIVQTRKTHPLYRKQYLDSRNFMAHDEKNEAQVGDRVSIVETRPLSAQKRFRLEKILDKAQIQHVEGVEARPASKSKSDATEKDDSSAKTTEPKS
jgi:small subunit ribosomal protein S17